MQALDHVLKRTEETTRSGRLPVVVFDLDSTLFDTAGRHLAILQAFAATEPELAPLVEQLSHADFGWHVHAPLARMGFTDEATLGRLETFWFERFFHDDWLQHDLPARGSVDFVNEVYRAGGLVYYLTGRHVGGMERGTLHALRDHGYPILRGRTVLHLKPDFHLGDKPFKDQALRDIRSHRGDVVATFENEPANANLLRSAFPEAHHFLVGSVCSPDSEPPHADLIAIDDFVPRVGA